MNGTKYLFQGANNCMDYSDDSVSITSSGHNSVNSPSIAYTIVIKQDCDISNLFKCTDDILYLTVESYYGAVRTVKWTLGRNVIAKYISLSNVNLQIDKNGYNIYSSDLSCRNSTGYRNIQFHSNPRLRLEGTNVFQEPIDIDSFDASIVVEAASYVAFPESIGTIVDIHVNATNVHIDNDKVRLLIVNASDVDIKSESLESLSITATSGILDIPNIKSLSLFGSIELKSGYDRLIELHIPNESFFSLIPIESMPCLENIKIDKITNSYWYQNIQKLTLFIYSDKSAYVSNDEMSIIMNIINENKNLKSLIIRKKLTERNLDLLLPWIRDAELFGYAGDTCLDYNLYPTTRIVYNMQRKVVSSRETQHNKRVNAKRRTLLDYCM